LLEAAAVWILDNAYGRSVDLSPCFNTPEEAALGLDSRTPGKFKFIGSKDELASDTPRLRSRPDFEDSVEFEYEIPNSEANREKPGQMREIEATEQIDIDVLPSQVRNERGRQSNSVDRLIVNSMPSGAY
jgi:hypothetical protein